jgi:hypothetical protein
MAKGSKRKQASEAKLSPHHPFKLAYETPRLVEYGNVTDITAGENGTKFDPGSKQNYSKRGT